MKTQVIQLEPHDDIISARDKMGWGQTQRVVLVWPHRARILTRQLDIQLLNRHSRQLGVQIALVTRIQDVRFYAHELGIPVFSTVHQAQTNRWRKVRRGRVRIVPLPGSEPADNGSLPAMERLEKLKTRARPSSPPWLGQPFIRLGIFSVGVLAVLAIASILVPSAEIKLTPDLKDQTLNFTAQADPSIESMQLSGVVPAREVIVIVEGRKTVPTTGKSLIPGTTASGTVRLSNLTAVSISVPVGTIIRTLDNDPVRFATTRSAVVPPNPDSFITMQVEAITRGSAGNQPAESLVAVEGPLGLQLRVTNPLPTLGGSDFQASSPTTKDRLELREELIDSLRTSASEEIEAQVFPGDLILSPPQLVEILEETYDPPDDQPAERLDLLLQVAFSAQVAQGEDLNGLANVILDSSLPQGYDALDETLSIRLLTTPQRSTGETTRWQMEANRKISAQLTGNQAINLVLGLPPGLANDRLSARLNLASAPTILMTPAWWPRLPIIPFRIQVHLDPGSFP
jgi:hypothetical protein